MTSDAATTLREPPVLLSEAGDDGVLVLTLNRPRQMSSLAEALLDQLNDAFDKASRDRSVRVVVIASQGRAFCAGHDLKEMTARRHDPDKGAAYFEHLMGKCARLMQSIVYCPKPVIAQVQGLAMAAGCQLVATCDLAVAAESAGFSTPGVDIGLFCSTPMVALSRTVSRKNAMEMLLTADVIDAHRACEMGLVNRVVPDNALADETMALARKIASKSTKTVSIGKEAFYRQIEMDLGRAYDYTARIMVHNMLTADAEEGINAFLEKRQPHWQDR